MNLMLRSFAMAALLASAQACAFTKKNSLSSSPSVPAAEGTAAFSRTSNDNTSVKVAVKHLPNPEKLQPPESTYVVWVQRNDGSAPVNIGALKVDRGLAGKLSTETPLHQFQLYITAEPNGQAQAPSGQHLLWTSYSR